MVTRLLVAATASLLVLAACEPALEQLGPAEQPLAFSADTVFFDTVFTATEAYTLRLTAYNPNDNAVNISQLAMDQGEASPFRLFAAGQQGATLTDVRLRGGDSLLVLVDVSLPPTNQDSPLLLQDKMRFELGAASQEVTVIAFAQDVHFINDDTLRVNTTFASGKPYVVNSALTVAEGATLTVEAGVEMYFAFNAVLAVQGRLTVEGTPESPVLFSNTRLDQTYENLPGQWIGLFFDRGSGPHQVRGAAIRNGLYGVIFNGGGVSPTPDLQLQQVRIENMAQAGLFCDSIYLRMENVLVNNCIGNTLNLLGGVAEVDHCTLAHTNQSFGTGGPALALFSRTEEDQVVTPAEIAFRNTAIVGASSEELGFQDLSTFSASFSNCLLTTNLDQFAGFESLGDDNLLRLQPDFVDPGAYDYRPSDISVLRGAGEDIGLATDLDGQPRPISPDIGALQFQPATE